MRNSVKKSEDVSEAALMCDIHVYLMSCVSVLLLQVWETRDLIKGSMLPVIWDSYPLGMKLLTALWLCVLSLTVMDDKNVAKLNELIQQG